MCASPILTVPLTSGRQGKLILRQVFLNVVLDDAVEEKNGGEKVRLGMVVSYVGLHLPSNGDADLFLGLQVIRGNSVVMLEVRLTVLFMKERTV